MIKKKNVCYHCRYTYIEYVARSMHPMHSTRIKWSTPDIPDTKKWTITKRYYLFFGYKMSAKTIQKQFKVDNKNSSDTIEIKSYIDVKLCVCFMHTELSVNVEWIEEMKRRRVKIKKEQIKKKKVSSRTKHWPLSIWTMHLPMFCNFSLNSHLNE